MTPEQIEAAVRRGAETGWDGLWVVFVPNDVLDSDHSDAEIVERLRGPFPSNAWDHLLPEMDRLSGPALGWDPAEAIANGVVFAREVPE